MCILLYMIQSRYKTSTFNNASLVIVKSEDQPVLSQVLGRTDNQPHGFTLTSANSRESILNDTYGIHRVDFPLMQIGGGLQMKDSKINKAVVSRQNSSVRTLQP